MEKRATKALIYTDNLRHNLKAVKSLIKAETKICGAVKADGYGHGAVEVSKILLAEGIDCLGVSAVSEGGELREAGIKAPILLFGHADPDELAGICRWKLQPFAGTLSYIKSLEKAAEKTGKTLKIHLKVDTGMGRIGCPPAEAPEIGAYIQASPFLKLQGTCTHFPVSDSISKEDREFTAEQIHLFLHTVDEVRRAGVDPGLIHAANSGAVASWPDAHFDMVRPGIILYGYYPDPAMKRPRQLKPVMQLESSISFLKEIEAGKSVSYGRSWVSRKRSLIGTIPVGYADGYNRLLSNRAEVVIRGKRYPLAGRICMDQTMIDLGSPGDEKFENRDYSDITVGEKVILFGQDESAPCAQELGMITGTIPYEVTCAVSKRVPRIYL
ncbi:MAG: alanine racemase [Spirochaetales bacterium]|nr:alanine racemase [Spirochaetales bacterium]